MDQYNNYHNEAEQGMNDKCDKKNAQNKADRGEMR